MLADTGKKARNTTMIHSFWTVALWFDKPWLIWATTSDLKLVGGTRHTSLTLCQSKWSLKTWNRVTWSSTVAPTTIRSWGHKSMTWSMWRSIRADPRGNSQLEPDGKGAWSNTLTHTSLSRPATTASNSTFEVLTPGCKAFARVIAARIRGAPKTSPGIRERNPYSVWRTPTTRQT